MKQISKFFIAVGLGIMFIGGMLDADVEFLGEFEDKKIAP
jgi:hypothetical protein